MELPMRKSTFALALSFLSAIVWFGSQLNQPHAAEDAKPARQKWEYRVDILQGRSVPQEQLNRDGEDGWELCAIYNYQNDRLLYFKRPK
jgi:hypothetical protein